MSDSTVLKHCDFIEFSKVCAAEYNKPELSDRILVFDVMQDGWETANILNGVSTIETVVRSEKQSLETPTIRQRELTEGKLNEIKDNEAETEENPESHDENESKDHHSSEISLRAGPETHSDEKPGSQVSAEVDCSINSIPSRESNENAAAMSSHTNEPLRQHKIYVHSFWLSIQSPYFRSLLHSSGMKENHDKEVHVKVSESEESAHLILLEALYRDDVLNDKPVDELLTVLELANKYDLKLVFKKCKYVLQKKATTLQVCTQIVHVVKEKQNFDDVEDLIETVKPVITKAFSPLDNHWESEKFTNLSEQCLRYVLSSDDLTVSSENVVFQALMYWMEQNKIDPKVVTDLLEVVRFKLVTIDYIYNVIKNNPTASKMGGFKDLLLAGTMYLAAPAQQKQLLEQPVSRQKPKETIIHYTRVIQSRKIQTALRNKTEIHSQKFWACGYKISAGLNPSLRAFFLIVHNLKKQSYVPLEFAISTSNKPFSSSKKKDFTVESCKENFKITEPGLAQGLMLGLYDEALTFSVAVTVPTG